MMDFRRALLAISLGLILLLIWQAWVDFQSTPQINTLPTESVVDAELPQTPEPRPQAETSTMPQAPDSSSTPLPQTVLPTASDDSGSIVSVETDLLKVKIDTLGAQIKDTRLIQYPVEVEMPDVPFRLLKDQPPEVLIAQSGLVGNDFEFPNHKTQYQAELQSYRLSEGEDFIEVPLHWESPDGVEYIKLFTFHRDSYLIDIEYQISNKSGREWQGYDYGQYVATEHQPDGEGFLFLRALPSYQGAAIYTPEDKYDKVDFKEIRNERPEYLTQSGWVAMLQHYFVTAWLPEENAPYRFYTGPLDGHGENMRYQVGYISQSPLTVANDSVGSINTRLYVGPKEQERIKDPAEGLILTVDYGWLTPVSSPLFWILDKINDFIQNWGFSIIVLTLLVKIVFYPLSAASYKSMARMKKLQPRLKTLKERYGDDKQKMNQEMMQIYKKEKINPLGGCLPILIQIPVFIALYWVLLESVELRQAPFIFWLTDLSRSDPFYVLPVLMGASMFAQQFLNPTPLDAMQKNIMMALPIVFTVFFLWFPSGLVLYWLVNNILSIAQQWYITRKLIAE
ncbi:MAG: membrane protein insertase YidC [Gammaproteobacteria bacterium]|nr:membrane protein insertase YidC [Gammaproteobacteria bacterium]